MTTERPLAPPAVRTLVSAVRVSPAFAVTHELVVGSETARFGPIAADASYGTKGISGSTGAQRIATLSDQLKGAPRGVPPRGSPV